MKIAIGSDHIGFPLKEKISQYLLDQNYQIIDCGTDSDQRCDYPLIGYQVAIEVSGGACENGILICGTGIGISLAANAVPNARAAVCSEPYSAQMSKSHNNANIIAFGARVIGEDVAKSIVDAFLKTNFEGGRHQKRVDMIEDIKKGKKIT